MKDKKLILSFKGTKQELHTQFKMLCAKHNVPMNTKILDLIEKEINQDK